MAELTIVIASHHFAVRRVSARAQPAVLSFASKYVQRGTVRVQNQGRRPTFLYNQPLRVFGAATGDRSEYRFHINTLGEFLSHIERTPYLLKGELIETVIDEIPPARRVELPIFDSWHVREDQVPVVQYIEKPPPPRSKFVNLQTGKGKAQPLDAKIKVPGGWKIMGEMQVGQEVISADGSVTTVTGVYPQGVREVFRITFADGRSTECCAEHLWEVYYINTQPHCRWRVVNTLEVLRLISMPNPRVYVRLAQPEAAAEQVLPMDPYLMGALLGDGHIGKQALRITTADAEMVQTIEEILTSEVKLQQQSRYSYGISKLESGAGKCNVYIRVMNDLGLGGKLSHEKFIPPQYLHSSTSQRLALLQGLLDTDGTVQQSGSVSFSTTSEQLARDVQYLVRSLGGIAAIRPRQTSFTHLGEKRVGKTCYDVDIRYAKPSELFRLTRKRERTNDQNQYADTLKLRVVSVECAGEKQTQCISVAHESRLYVTDDFIVTHNSFCTMRAVSNVGTLPVLIVRPMYLEKWVIDIRKTYDIDIKDLMLVQGGAQLQALLVLAQNDMLDCKIVLLSNKTYQNWLKLYEKFGDQTLEMGYACTPGDFFRHLKAGYRIIDEVHQDFHLNFKIDLYTHVEQSVSLSATLVSDDDFINKMYQIAYPQSQRYEGEAYDRYIAAKAILWRAEDPRWIRWKGGDGSYSHIEFEKSLRRRGGQTKERYYALIEKVLRGLWLQKDYEPGERAIIFCASTEMCTEVVEYLRRKFPDKDVRRYCPAANDPYENLMEPDIRVATLIGAGTAVDIPNLTTTLLTQAIASSQSNIQGFGRLRNLANGKTPRFAYWCCEDVAKHLEYHERKKKLLQSRALNYEAIFINELI